MSRKFQVTAERGNGVWVLESDLGAVSQVRRLDQAADEMREALAYLAGRPGFDHFPAFPAPVPDSPGIPESVRERMFYPLVSGREGGSGLGLTIAQNFVQHHHGTIDCVSRPGQTVFTIRLPVEQA